MKIWCEIEFVYTYLTNLTQNNVKVDDKQIFGAKTY